MINTYVNESNNLFAKVFMRLIHEEMTAATAFGLGAQTDQGGAVPGGSDFYASGDSRVPKVLGGRKRGKVKMQRRPLTNA